MNATVTIKFCPKCKGTDLALFAGGVTGTWQCRNCGFLGSLFPEKIVEVEKAKDKKQPKINRKEKTWQKKTTTIRKKTLKKKLPKLKQRN